MKRLGLLVGAALLIAFLDPPDSLACTCTRPPPPQAAMAQAAAVFLGKVTAIDGDPGRGDLLKVTFSVSRTWRGLDGTSVAVYTEGSGPMCGYAFRGGVEYLVYAHTSQGRLSVSLCSRTRPADAAMEDLEALGPGRVPTASR